jgi:hypothetical protein
MAENPKPVEENPKLILLKFEYRRTGMGAVSDTILISFKSGKVIKSRLHTSKTGNHGTRTYLLLPAKYLMYEVYKSNLGNVYILIKVVQLKEDGTLETLNQWQMYERKEQTMLLNDLPENIRTLLINNKDQLPLFYYIYQDQSE